MSAKVSSQVALVESVPVGLPCNLLSLHVMTWRLEKKKKKSAQKIDADMTQLLLSRKNSGRRVDFVSAVQNKRVLPPSLIPAESFLSLALAFTRRNAPSDETFCYAFFASLWKRNNARLGSILHSDRGFSAIIWRVTLFVPEIVGFGDCFFTPNHVDSSKTLHSTSSYYLRDLLVSFSFNYLSLPLITRHLFYL